MPRFSVVIACYNAAVTLPATLASLQAQTLQDWEAICVDDGSTDATAALLGRAAAADPRIRVVTKPNTGPSIARNTGVAQASAAWVAFLDADDIWLPDKLAETAKTIATTDGIDATYAQIAFCDAECAVQRAVSQVTSGPTPLDRLLGENPVCTLSNLSVRRDLFLALGGFRADMRFSEDLEFLIRLVAAGGMLVGAPQLLVRYRASAQGLSANLAQMHDGWRRAVQSAGAILTPRQRARAEALHLRYLARRALRLDLAPMAALRLALSGVRLAPAAFLGGGHRGPATLISCLVAPFLPVSLRRALFA